MTIKDYLNASPQKGKIFCVTFLKKDGTIRKMVARLGVKKGVKGNGKEAPTHIVRSRQMQKRAWRSFDVRRVLSLTSKGKTYYFF